MKKKLGNIMLIVRRVHLYTGLFLFPWVILYGFTALLFNHAGMLSDRSVSHLQPAELEELLPGDKLIEAYSIAESVVVGLRKKMGEGKEVSEPRNVKFTGFATFRAMPKEDSEKSPMRRTIILDPELMGGKVYTLPQDVESDAVDPEELKKINIPIPDISDWMERAVALSNKKNWEHGDILSRNTPDIEFEITMDNKLWLCNYDIAKNDLTARTQVKPVEGEDVRGFVLRLHKYHGYLNTKTTRLFWAVIVDIMAVTMVFWGVSGMLMWAQMKRLRTIGVIVSTIGIGSMVILVTLMWQEIG